jgi:tRNA modification GTPase
MRDAASEIEVLTPPGRGAVAVILCTGDIAILDGSASTPPLCAARDGRPFKGRPLDRINFARWGEVHPEDVVVCRTDNDEFEIHCHGGTAAVERIRADLNEHLQGGRGWSERSEGSPGAATSNDLIDAAWAAVTQATTLRTANLLLHQAAIAWPALLDLQASGRCEPADGLLAHATLIPRGTHQGADAPRSPGMIRQSLAWSEFGRHLTEPWTVALVGKPNAGKSSLMNALAGFQRSIVNATPGTTRDAVTLDVALDGWPVRLVDTAGLRDSADELEAAGIARAQHAMATADLVLQVFDVTAHAPSLMGDAIPVANKIDLLPPAADGGVGVIGVSALTGAGVQQLIERIVARLILRAPLAGLAIPVCAEHIAWLENQT